MEDRYDPKAIEPKWQARWEEAETFVHGRRPQAEKRYVLEMLPYPSGKMHMGHVRNYLLGDVYARYYRMRGFDVFHPMGWDAFGLPAENAAIKDGVHPAARTAENIASFKQEIRRLGYAYDWTSELNTSEPEYYRWNQWFFLKMREAGLVYRRFSKVNWCTGCHTVIANEQVKEGVCERCDSQVLDKEMPEWAFRITRYSQDLLDGLDTLTEWPERVTAMQRNWIGRSEGVEADFAIEGHEGVIRIFTTRIDTVFGSTYVVLAPEHPLVAEVTRPEQRADVDAFVAKMAKTRKEDRTDEAGKKEGVFTGAYAKNPFNGERIPIWIANFVLADYGTGAVMSVPAHDARDFAFAREYGLPIKRVVTKPGSSGDGKGASGDGDAPGKGDGDASSMDAAFTDEGVLVDSGDFSGLSSAEARARMAALLEKDGRGKSVVTYRQRDWGFSRQRYWGTPIPIVYCEKCDPKHEGIPVPESELPIRLPEIDTQAVLTGKGEPPLAKVKDFVETTCPTCSGPARREVETMDTFVDSCWYYARYLSPKDEAAAVDAAEAERWLPVDIYVGGPEHAVMHLLYFRFWTRVMKELGLVPTDEPVKRLVTQGIVNGPDGRKMSKRWGNVIAPASIVDKYGADTARVYTLFAGPPERDFDWSEDQVEGAYRFLKRVWALAFLHRECAREASAENLKGAEGKSLEVRRAAHKCLAKVTKSIERLSFNTAIAAAMECLNSLASAGNMESAAEKAAMAEAIGIFTAVLTPVAPHLADEISELYGLTTPTVDRAWPDFDAALTQDDVITYAVQVNGKLRGDVQLPADADEATAKAAAEAHEKVAPHLEGKTLRKLVFVPKRLINFVVSG